MVFMRDGVLGRSVLSEVLPVLRVLHMLTRLAIATAATATAPPPASTTAVAFATLAFAAFDFLFGFGGEFGRFLEMFVDLDRLVFHFRYGRQLRLLSGEIACGFGRVHLFTAVDDIRLLTRDRRVGRYRNGDAEALL